MSDEKKLEAKSAERTERRQYDPPTIGDFFQPLVVLGTIPTEQFVCPGAARPKPPKP
jgi:hypothetical protein